MTHFIFFSLGAAITYVVIAIVRYVSKEPIICPHCGKNADKEYVITTDEYGDLVEKEINSSAEFFNQMLDDLT